MMWKHQYLWIQTSLWWWSVSFYSTINTLKDLHSFLKNINHDTEHNMRWLVLLTWGILVWGLVDLTLVTSGWMQNGWSDFSDKRLDAEWILWYKCLCFLAFALLVGFVFSLFHSSSIDWSFNLCLLTYQFACLSVSIPACLCLLQRLLAYLPPYLHLHHRLHQIITNSFISTLWPAKNNNKTPAFRKNMTFVVQ